MTLPLTPRRGRTPSIEDVARAAGVSAQTVSRVANASDKVRPATRELVLAAMSELGYRPNRAARALRNGRFRTLGVIAPTFERTGEALSAQSVVEAADAEGYSVTLLTVHEAPTERWYAALRSLSQTVDGVIIVGAEHLEPDSFAPPPGLPVSVNDPRFAGHHPTVGADQTQGSRDAVQHLLSLGHRVVHHIPGPASSDHALARTNSWRDTLSDAGIRPPGYVPGGWTAESGYRRGLQLLRDDSVTAVFAANDDIAFGLMRAAYELGRRIPDDLSVVGFDGIHLSEFTGPPLTTVKQDFEGIGRELVRLVLKQVEDPDAVTSDTRVSLSTSLLLRSSTAPPRP